jgi:hypothetical protein
MKLLRSAIMAILTLFATISHADIADGQFGINQIFDVQYYWSGTTLNASNFIAPYDKDFNTVTTASGQYFQFFASTTNPGTYGMKLMNADGTFNRVIHDYGTITAIGNDAIFYLGTGWLGNVITTSAGYSYGQSDTFTNMDTSVSSSDLTSYTYASTTPLAAGQTAGSVSTPTYVAITSANVVSVTPTSTNSPSGEGASNVIDGSSATKYLNFDRASAGFTIKLSQGRVVEKFTITTANDYSPRDPSKFSLFGSNDGVTWTTIADNQSITLSDSRYTTSSDIVVTNTNAYVYYFITFDSTKALDLYPNMTNCMSAYGGGWLGTENCNSVQVSEVKYYYDSASTVTSADTGNGTIANPGTSGAVSSLNTTPTVVSTAAGADIVSTSTSNGTTTTATTTTRGTTSSVTVITDTRDQQTKVLNINRNITVTDTTPVTTTVTQTTPVTTTTTTTPTTVTTYSDGTTTTTNGTAVVTTNVTNNVVSNSTTVNDIVVTSTDTPYSTRIDQFAMLEEANTRENLALVSDPLIRHRVYDGEIKLMGANVNEHTAFTIQGSSANSNSQDGYSFKTERYSLGLAHRVRNDLLIGGQFTQSRINLAGNNSTGLLGKHAVNLYALWSRNDWLVKTDVGYADNSFSTTHTLPALELANSASASGDDRWAAVRLYTPAKKGVRAFVGARQERNHRAATTDLGSTLSAVDYPASTVVQDTTEAGLRFDHYLNNNLSAYAEYSQNNKQLETAKAGLSYQSSNRAVIQLGAVQQKQNGLRNDGVMLELKIVF